MSDPFLDEYGIRPRGRRARGESYYDVAQVCRAGHVITGSAEDHPAHRQAHCERCGESTMMACDACQQPIRGDYFCPGVISIGTYERPRFCLHCGKPYPWTSAALESARVLASELEQLSADERGQLKDSVDLLVRESPQTALATHRFKKLVSKAGLATGETFKNILADVLAEAVKKQIWP